MTTLRTLSEFGFIEQISAFLPSNANVLVGLGDDCAVVQGGGDRLWLLSCDASLEKVHFRRDWASAEEIGWKAAASALSDIAAMGGRPAFVLTTVAAPGDMDADFLQDVMRGMAQAAESCQAVIVGGDTTRAIEGLLLDVSVIGETVEGAYRLRKGTQPGDVLCVTGCPGLSTAGLRALLEGRSAPELRQAHLHPVPRIAEGQWLASRAEVHAMLDVSDGLLQDAGHLAKAAALGLDIDPDSLPMAPVLQAYAEKWGWDPISFILSGGEAYELAFSVSAAQLDALIIDFQNTFELQVTPVGQFTKDWSGVRVAGKAPVQLGFDHFQGQ